MLVPLTDRQKQIYDFLSVTVREETVADNAYAVTWKGNTVVALIPAGAGYPTYRRDDWLENIAPQAPWPYPIQSRRIRW